MYGEAESDFIIQTYSKRYDNSDESSQKCIDNEGHMQSVRHSSGMPQTERQSKRVRWSHSILEEEKEPSVAIDDFINRAENSQEEEQEEQEQ